MVRGVRLVMFRGGFGLVHQVRSDSGFEAGFCFQNQRLQYNQRLDYDVIDAVHCFMCM